jgi:D-aminoacyl-tRNA deacylase
MPSTPRVSQRFDDEDEATASLMMTTKQSYRMHPLRSTQPSAPQGRIDAMRAVIQRVTRAQVVVEGHVTGEIDAGLVVLIAVGREDLPATAASMAEKIVNLRIFNDEQGKMNRSLLDTSGSVLAVSQFTLYGDARGQRRPSFLGAAPPDQGKAGYEEFVRALQALNVHVATGVFQAHMSLELLNDGPVTILLDSDKLF